MISLRLVLKRRSRWRQKISRFCEHECRSWRRRRYFASASRYAPPFFAQSLSHSLSFTHSLSLTHRGVHLGCCAPCGKFHAIHAHTLSSTHFHTLPLSHTHTYTGASIWGAARLVGSHTRFRWRVRGLQERPRVDNTQHLRVYRHSFARVSVLVCSLCKYTVCWLFSVLVC